jgi:hypothetical protein
MKRIFTILLLFLMTCLLVRASDYYWTNSQPASATYQAGDTVHLVGTFTGGITITNSGTTVNPITFLFEPNAKFSVPTFSGVLIQCNQSNVVIDGGQNGIIEATANGTGLAYSNDFAAIQISGAFGVLVKNLLIQNLYVNVAGSDENGATAGIEIYNTCGNITVTNCVIHDMKAGIWIAFGAGCSNILYSHCTAYNCNWGGGAGDTGSSSTLNGLTVDHCHFYNWQNWDDNGDWDHHNGFYCWAGQGAGGLASNVTYSANHVGPGYGAHNTAGLFISGNVDAILVFNNLFDASDGSSPANAQLNVGLSSSSTTRIFNNTFIGAQGFDIGGGGGVSTSSFLAFNNEFYNCSFPIELWNNVTYTFWSDTNNFYSAAGNQQFNASNNGNGAFYNFAGWQSYGGYGSPWDAHSTASNPNLNNLYEPQANSPLLGAGVYNSLVAVDYNGVTRPNPPSIGAFEVATTNAPPQPICFTPFYRPTQ